MDEGSSDTLGISECSNEMQLEPALVSVGEGGHTLEQAAQPILAHTVNLHNAPVNTLKGQCHEMVI
jgi:hypothetical protein